MKKTEFVIIILISLSAAIFLSREGEIDRGAVVTIGVENQLLLKTPFAELTPAEYHDKAPVTVRLESKEVDGDLYLYDFRYAFLQPGVFNVSDYIINLEGTGTIDPVEVEGLTVIPKSFKGELMPLVKVEVPFDKSYPSTLYTLIAVWVVWTALMYRLYLYRPAAAVAQQDVAPSLIETIRRFLAEVKSESSIDLQAELELLIHRYANDELHCSEEAVKNLEALRRDARWGGVLEVLDAWLHRPGARDTDQLLASLENKLGIAP